MSTPIMHDAIKQLFTEARSYHAWLDKSVAQDTLRQLYDLLRWPPTSVNSMPGRFVFVQSAAAKEKLYPALMASNVEQVKAAPVTAIVAYDEKFFDQLKMLFPAYDATAMFSNDAKLSTETAFRNSTLQGAYMMIAARALGLDVCPLSGFDNARVDLTFLANTRWRSNFLCNLGYGDKAKLNLRSPRLNFEQACKLI